MITHSVLYGVAFTCNCVFVAGTLFSPLMTVDPMSAYHLYKTGDLGGPNEYDYTIVKRGPQDTQEAPDSKERRSQMGSSFIRFGRARLEQGHLMNPVDYSSISGDASNEFSNSMTKTPSDSLPRTARGRSDVIIRFGRSEFKNLRDENVPADSQQLIGTDLMKLLEYENNRYIKLSGNLPLEAARLLDRPKNTDRRVAIICLKVLMRTTGSANDADAYTADPSLYFTRKLLRLCESLRLGIEKNDEHYRRIRGKIIDIIEDAALQAESMKGE